MADAEQREERHQPEYHITDDVEMLESTEDNPKCSRRRVHLSNDGSDSSDDNENDDNENDENDENVEDLFAGPQSDCRWNALERSFRKSIRQIWSLDEKTKRWEKIVEKDVRFRIN